MHIFVHFLLVLVLLADVGWSGYHGKKKNGHHGIVPKERIIGSSKVADFGRFQVSFFNVRYPHFCGGAIIASSWIITSAHCKGVCEKNNMCAVRYGTLDLKNGHIAPIKRFIVHEDYSKSPFLINDIALAESPLELSVDFKVIPIRSFDVPFRKSLTLVGWGWMENKIGSCSQHLRFTNLKRVKCPPGLSQSFFCAYDKDSNPCHGDSGGSLIYDDELVGLVGFSLTGIEGNSDSREPGDEIEMIDDLARYKRDLGGKCRIGETVAFTYLSKFIPWIEQTIRNVSLYDVPAMKPWTASERNLMTTFRSSKSC